MAGLSPDDARVALLSFPRRFRGVLTTLQDDDDPETLVRRAPAGGMSALDHAGAAATVAHAAAAAEMRAARAGRAAGGPPDTGVPGAGDRSVEAVLDELQLETASLADDVGAMPADDWSRTTDADGTPRSALDIVRSAVDAIASHLRGAERALVEARRR